MLFTLEPLMTDWTSPFIYDSVGYNVLALGVSH